jgi:hypothetical protein
MSCEQALKLRARARIRAELRLDRLPALAGELVRLNVDVLVTLSTPAALAAKHVTSRILRHRQATVSRQSC